MKKLFIFFLICSGVYVCLNYDVPYVSEHLQKIRNTKFFRLHKERPVVTEEGKYSDRDDYFGNAFRSKKSNIPATGSGRVVSVMSDQFGKTKQQRFIVSLSSGQMLEVKHTIEKNDRIPLKIGDHISFYGIYNFTRKGGEITNTSRDLNNNGWVKHNGKVYH